MVKRRPTLQDVLSRPALNGGWDKLVEQQHDQLERLVRLEARFDKVDKTARWVVGTLGTGAVGIIGHLIMELLSRVHFVIH